MRCPLAVPFVALALFGCAGDPPADDLPGPPQAFDAQRFDSMETGVFKSYLQLQDALAHDELDAAQSAARSLVDQADGELADLAQAAATAADITALRATFRPLSEHMISRELPAGLEVAYCPMAFDYEGGRWVQTEGHITNPYYGAAMLRCGAFEEDSPNSDSES
ncbi:MAG: DUF3347 domain-containing protein [Candidatus Latescibacteria bacterium]|jgi:hypothetical protein|nr:hypothetical protein [Gemmatimonadaceae bacterium]MDP6014680.1 DUF3347 domain-containing protein [Candidatus Latescibacterota bacterium]MDP7447393.1 DUF3347 domain-containing protein [Candidatus Latescibacterota bacterium]HJP29283.1 DUF3347 domain-containing protein [Candidatus Latescibacterota bacterium]|tara:strand:+ start:78 stop:572 length:495 start_codon:yes stop_codon:yes gene_type:complete